MMRTNDRPRLRPVALLSIALVASAPSVGCQTTKPKTTTTMSGIPGGAPGGAEPAGPKTEFHREVGAEQEFNVHMELARFHEVQENHEAAIVEYQKAADVCGKKGSLMSHSKIGPAQQSLAHRRMAAAYDRLGRFAQAEPHYLKALKLTPGDTKVWNDAGYSYYLQNRLPDAERALKTADSLDPSNPRSLTNLGLVLAASGKDDEALAALSRAAGPAVGHANLGFILAALGKTDKARRHYQEAVALQPGLTAAKQALVKLDAAQVKPPAALASAPAVNPAVTVNPKPPLLVASPTAAIPLPGAAVKDRQLTRTSSTAKVPPPPALAPIPAPSPRS